MFRSLHLIIICLHLYFYSQENSKSSYILLDLSLYSHSTCISHDLENVFFPPISNIT